MCSLSNIMNLKLKQAENAPCFEKFPLIYHRYYNCSCVYLASLSLSLKTKQNKTKTTSIEKKTRLLSLVYHEPDIKVPDVHLLTHQLKAIQ